MLWIPRLLIKSQKRELDFRMSRISMFLRRPLAKSFIQQVNILNQRFQEQIIIVMPAVCQCSFDQMSRIIPVSKISTSISLKLARKETYNSCRSLKFVNLLLGSTTVK